MDIDFNEISKLSDFTLISKTLNAFINKCPSIIEKKIIYQKIFQSFIQNKIKLDPVFFNPYAQILFDDNEYEQLKKLAIKSNHAQIHLLYIEMGFSIGKLDEIQAVEQVYLEKLLLKGLNSQLITIVNKLNNYLGLRFSLEVLKIKALINMSNEKDLISYLINYRHHYLLESKEFIRENININDFYELTSKNISLFSYRTMEFYLEQIRWSLTLDIKKGLKNEKLVPKALDLLIISNEIEDFYLLTAYFSNLSEGLGRLLKIYTKELPKYKSIDLIKKYPYYLKYFKEAIGTTRKQINKSHANEIAISHQYKSPIALDNFIYKLTTNSDTEKYAERIEECFFNWVVEDSIELKSINFYDLLLLLRDLNFINSVEKIYLVANEKNLITERERYLVGRALFEANKLSRAHNILTYSESEQGLELLNKIANLIDRDRNA